MHFHQIYFLKSEILATLQAIEAFPTIQKATFFEAVQCFYVASDVLRF